MTLSFSTQINGMPNFFIEKIWIGLIEHQYSTYTECNKYQKAHITKFMEYWDSDKESNLIKRQFPKLHTIRTDENDQWRPGMKIHFVVNNRFQFAPVLQVVSVQRILIVSEIQNGTHWNYVIVGGKMLPAEEVLKLAQNDGFENDKQFFAYFSNNYQKLVPQHSGNFSTKSTKWEYCGKIIHWTNLKY